MNLTLQGGQNSSNLVHFQIAFLNALNWPQ